MFCFTQNTAVMHAVTALVALSALLFLTIAQVVHAGVPVDVRGKVCLITGGSRGIGAAVAKQMAGAGMKVVLAARSMASMDKVVAGIQAAGGQATAVACDIKKEEDVAAAFAHAKAVFGPVSFVFANAGAIKLTALDAFAASDVRHVLDINLIGPMLTFRAAYPHFVENGGGVIVYCSSMASTMRGSAYGAVGSAWSTYSISKSGIDMLNRATLAYHRENIRTYTLNPAVYSTQMVDEFLELLPEELGMTSPDEAAGFNPFFTGQSGDPAEMGPLMLALFNNSTLYENGAGIGCDGPASFDINVLYRGIQDMRPVDENNGMWVGLDAERDLRNPDGSAPYTGRMPATRRLNDAEATKEEL